MRNPLFLIVLSLLAAQARASEEDGRILGPADDVPLLEQAAHPRALDPEQRYERTNEVFRHFGIPLETAQPDALAAFEETQSAAGAARILSRLDPTHQFDTWFAADAGGLTAFLDGGVKRLTDYRVSYAPSDEGVRATGLLERLRDAARGNPAKTPLAGLKIALDPGHMGTDVWDERTGKFVKDKKGNKISEALINLQTCLLVEKGLSELGAEVVITHRDLAPVYSVPYEQLPLADFARNELHSESLQPWFQALLNTGSGDKLAAAFDKSPQVKKLFSEFERINYFQLRADLDARVDFIRAANPDITLIVHYDADKALVDPKVPDGTKTYVVGDFAPTEFGTQKLRTQLARRLVDREGWDTSLALNRFVVHQLQQELGVPFDRNGGGTSSEVEPGVFARNLGIPSQLDGQAVSYIEVLQYGDPSEFERLRQFTHTISIGGKDYPYSDRLATAASAIVTGVAKFVESYGN